MQLEIRASFINFMTLVFLDLGSSLLLIYECVIINSCTLRGRNLKVSGIMTRAILLM